MTPYERLIREVWRAGTGVEQEPAHVAEFICGVHVGLVVAFSDPEAAARMLAVLRTAGSQPEATQAAAVSGARHLIAAIAEPQKEHQP